MNANLEGKEQEWAEREKELKQQVQQREDALERMRAKAEEKSHEAEAIRFQAKLAAAMVGQYSAKIDVLQRCLVEAEAASSRSYDQPAVDGLRAKAMVRSGSAIFKSPSSSSSQLTNACTQKDLESERAKLRCRLVEAQNRMRKLREDINGVAAREKELFLQLSQVRGQIIQMQGGLVNGGLVNGNLTPRSSPKFESSPRKSSPQRGLQKFSPLARSREDIKLASQHLVKGDKEVVAAAAALAAAEAVATMATNIEQGFAKNSRRQRPSSENVRKPGVECSSKRLVEEEAAAIRRELRCVMNSHWRRAAVPGARK